MTETAAPGGGGSSLDEMYEREVSFLITRDNGPGDGFTLEGYAAVFNSPTQINDRDGQYEEMIAPGAFKRTIAGGNPVLMFDHGQHPVLGSMPIGSLRSIREDPHGLFISARLFDNWMTEPLRQAITADPPAIKGMSFRFQVVKDIWDHSADTPQRTLKEVRLFELGPVVFPAYGDTTVALRSLASHVPGLKLVFEDQTPVVVRSDGTTTEDPGTPDEPATDRGTSEGLAAPSDPDVDDAHSRDLQERSDWLASRFPTSPKE